MKTFTAVSYEVVPTSSLFAYLFLSGDAPSEKPPIREPGKKPFESDPERRPPNPPAPSEEPPMEIPPEKSPGKEIPPRM